MSEAANARLQVDLQALAGNYATLSGATGASVAGVVKADAYGTGAEAVVPALAAAGCDVFFAGFLNGARQVRLLAPAATVFVLNPVIRTDATELLANGLIPCLYDPAEAVAFAETCEAAGQRPRIALHVDTGMHRLGMSATELAALRQHRLWPGFDIALLMSHLACADEPGHPLNERQLREFESLRRDFPGVPASLANSGGVFLGSRYHFDLVRPGIALYGHDPHYDGGRDRVTPVAELTVRIGQVAWISAGDSIGYGATVTVERETCVATLLAGYADGIPRALGDAALEPPPECWCAGRRVPVRGRISMDLTTLDVTACVPPPAPFSDRAEVFGRHIRLEEHARRLNTIPYELLTQVGNRVARAYRQ